MGILKFACSRCWDYNCKCTPEELKEYDEQCKINSKKIKKLLNKKQLKKQQKNMLIIMYSVKQVQILNCK